jgi:predicted transcriptional regulator
MMSFAETLKRIRKKAGISRYQLWKFSGVDQSYLAKLESGEKGNPSRSMVILIGMGLVHASAEIQITDIDELLWMADYAPLRKRDITPGVKNSINR